MFFETLVSKVKRHWFAAPLSLVVVIGLLSVIVGCSDSQKFSDASPEAVGIARVGDEVITEDDVDFMLERSFNTQAVVSAGAPLRGKVLESLIASRAMKQRAETLLTDAEQKQLQAKVRAYEEELYVQAYLERNIVPQPVTGEMVQNYYKQHPKQFGGETLRQFELLVAPANLDDSRQAELLAEVPTIQATPNWEKTHDRWQERFGLRYQSGKSRSGLLEPALDNALKGLEPGETSSVVYLDGQLHLLRLTAVTQTAPKALSEVREEIRKKLAPLHLKEAVRQASEQARSEVNVQILAEEKQ